MDIHVHALLEIATVTLRASLTTYIYLFFFTVLASWFRLKYPHVTLGALASSAPILYFDDIVSPETGYYSIASRDFRVIYIILYFVSFNSKKQYRLMATCTLLFSVNW